MQGDLNPVPGAEGGPRRHLDFPRSISSKNVRDDLLRFIAERHDGHLRLVAHLWDDSFPDSKDSFMDSLQQLL